MTRIEPPASPHDRHGMLQRRRHAPRIDGENPVPLVEIEPLGLPPRRHQPGIGDDHIDPPEFFARSGEGGSKIGFGAHISGRELEAGGKVCRGALRFQVERQTGRPGPRKRLDDRQSQPAAAAGDERDAPAQEFASFSGPGSEARQHARTESGRTSLTLHGGAKYVHMFAIRTQPPGRHPKVMEPTHLPHAEVLREAEPRSTHNGVPGALWMILRDGPYGPPQDEGVGVAMFRYRRACP